MCIIYIYIYIYTCYVWQKPEQLDPGHQGEEQFPCCDNRSRDQDSLPATAWHGHRRWWEVCEVSWRSWVMLSCRRNKKHQMSTSINSRARKAKLVFWASLSIVVMMMVVMMTMIIAIIMIVIIIEIVMVMVMDDDRWSMRTGPLSWCSWLAWPTASLPWLGISDVKGILAYSYP